MNMHYPHDLGVLSILWTEFCLFCGAVGRLCFILFGMVLSLISHGSLHLIWGMFDSGRRFAKLFYCLNAFFTSLNDLCTFIIKSLIYGACGLFSSPWCFKALYGFLPCNMGKRLPGAVDFGFALTSALRYMGIRLILYAHFGGCHLQGYKGKRLNIFRDLTPSYPPSFELH